MEVKRIALGLRLLAVVSLLLAGGACQARQPARTPVDGADTAPPAASLEGLAVEAIDGTVVVATRLLSGRPGFGAEARMPWSAAPFGRLSGESQSELGWRVTAGEGRFVVDPFSGNTIFTPEGEEPLKVRPVWEGIEGPEIEIGISPTVIPADQRPFRAAGGGACSANPNHAGLLALTGGPFTVDVRSVVNASVMARTRDRREVVYRNAQYHGWSDKAGPFRIRHNPALISRTTMTSLADGSPDRDFFPARTESEMYFIIDFIDHGLSIFNKKPMRLGADHTAWPPFRTPQINRTGEVTEFYSLAEPNVKMLEITSQEMYVYPTAEIEVTQDQFEVNEGTSTFQANFRLRNRTQNHARLRWFVLGDAHAAEGSQEGIIQLAPGAESRVALSGRVEPHLLTQFLTLGVVSETEPRMTGFGRVEFLFPRETPVRESLLAKLGDSARR